MYVSPGKRRVTVILAILGISLIPISVAALLLYQDWRSKAVVGEKPEDVRMSDVTETSAVLSWITPDKSVEGWIQYSSTAGISDGSPLAQDDRDVRSGTTSKRTTHYVTLSNLQPDTTYYFVIGSGKNAYKDTSQNEFTLATAPLGSDVIPTPDPVYGSVTNSSDQSAIVYITLANGTDKSFPVSTLTNDSGNFEVDLAHIRTADLGDKFDYTDDTEMITFAQGGDLGGAVLRSEVKDRDALSLTMTADYDTTDIFADSSGIDTGDTDGDDDDDDDPPADDDDDNPPVDDDADNDGVSDADDNCPNRANSSQSDFDGDGIGDACDSDTGDGDDDIGDDDTGDDDTSDDDDSGEYPAGSPSDRRDVPLTQLVLGSSTVATGISNISVTNVTENSFTVIWESAVLEVGSVMLGESADALTTQARDSRDSVVSQSAYYLHHVAVGNLAPETTYYYDIHSGAGVYDDDGLPYSITVPATQDAPPEFYSIFGEVTGTSQSDAVVVGKIVNDSGASASVSAAVDDGSWTLSLGGVRTQDYSAYFSYTDADTLELTVRTRGNAKTEEYVLADISEDVVTTALNMVLPETGGDAGEFDRGLYATVKTIDVLPDTAVDRLTAIGLTVSILLLLYGTYLLASVYSGSRNDRWEKEFLRSLGPKDA